MIILGIETSCDESGIALYDEERGLLAHRVYSQITTHAPFGGVVPELASRDHIRKLVPLVYAVLSDAACELADIDVIAYTAGPGLAGALLVGASIASGLGYALGIPVIPLHHLEGHLLSALLVNPAPTFPFNALLVSGGHTQLITVFGVGNYHLLGETVDDAVGEAFDKTAKLLGLAYPGGPELSRVAQYGRGGRFRLPRPMLNSGDYNFSFSGLKTAVVTLVKDLVLDAQTIADIAHAFQDAVVDVLVSKSINAMVATKLDQLVVVGGVGANTQLRQRFSEVGIQQRLKVFYPDVEFCTDNAAMISYACAARIKSDHIQRNLVFSVSPRWELGELASH